MPPLLRSHGFLLALLSTFVVGHVAAGRMPPATEYGALRSLVVAQVVRRLGLAAWADRNKRRLSRGAQLGILQFALFNLQFAIDYPVRKRGATAWHRSPNSQLLHSQLPAAKARHV